MKRLLLLLVIALPAAASAQTLDTEGVALPLLREFGELSSSTFAVCTPGETIANDAADAAFGVGPTGAPGGTARKIGQSFVPRCTGRADSLFIVYQTRPDGETGAPGTTVAGNVLIYQGEGTAGTLIDTAPFSFVVRPAGFAYFQGINTNALVTEGNSYTFFYDITSGNSVIQGSITDLYKDGQYYSSTTGGPAGAVANPARDVRFVMRFAPGGVASEAGPAGSRISLGASTPNPVRSASTLTFTTEAASTARVAVYDVLGREVAVLADGPVGAGSHSVRFDAAALAPGAYVVRLVANGATVSQTVSVVR